jgi:hypothetical protein
MKPVFFIVAMLVASTAAMAQSSPHCGQNSKGSVERCSACIARTKPGQFTESQRRGWCANRIAELKAQGKFK